MARLSKAEKLRRKRARPPSKAKLKWKARRARLNALDAWSARGEKKCAVCGIGRVPKMKDGKQVIGKKAKRPIFINLHKHHILSKEQYSEFSILDINRLVLCPLHHKYGKYSFHKNQLWAMLWLRENRSNQYHWAKKNMGNWR